jgi:hypothetical protein
LDGTPPSGLRPRSAGSVGSPSLAGDTTGSAEGTVVGAGAGIGIAAGLLGPLVGAAGMGGAGSSDSW